MNTSIAKTTTQIRAISARVTAKTLHVLLNDGRQLRISLAKVSWLKWLAEATAKERANCSLEPGGFAIYWPNLDDGVEVCHLLDSLTIA